MYLILCKEECVLESIHLLIVMLSCLLLFFFGDNKWSSVEGVKLFLKRSKSACKKVWREDNNSGLKW